MLLPARTSLRALERALERDGIPYRAETSSLVYGTGEIRDLLMVARAVEDPTDSLAVVAALRTAAFGCGDDDLYGWRQTHGGRWDHQRPRPASAPDGDIVGEGLSWLGKLHRERLWLAPSQILERIVRERRLMEVAFVHPRPRDLWRRLRFVVDQCRAWEEAGGTTLREYLAWVRLQSAEGARVIETVLPETDDDAVRILTIHGAKGLEFPITVLSGLTTQLSRRPGGVQVLFPPGRRWAVHLKKDLETAEFADHQPIEEQMDWHERLRLLYVAATRARDHLIVSVHRKEGAASDTTAAGLFYESGWDAGLVEELGPALPLDEAAAPARPVPVAEVVSSGLPSLAEWEQERSAAFLSASRPVAVSATRLAEEAARALELEALAGVQKDPRDLDLPPWQKGRYGSAMGRAVHAVLQTVDLSTGAGLAEAAAAQAAAEGVLGREGVIEAFCRASAGVGRGPGGGSTPPLAGGLRRHSVRRWGARGVHRPALPRSGRTGRRRLQDRQLARRGRPSAQSRPIPGATTGVRCRRGGSGRRDCGRTGAAFPQCRRCGPNGRSRGVTSPNGETHLCHELRRNDDLTAGAHRVVTGA